jgi:hypothetical protein
MSADRDRLQRGLQRDPEQRHRGRRERGRGRRSDEVLRGGAAPGDDAARHHHPADLLFGQDLQAKLPADLQAAIVRAGKEAGAYGRQVESSEDSAKLDVLEKAGKLKRVPFADRDAMKKLVDPVMAAYAKEIGADAIFEQDHRRQVALCPRSLGDAPGLPGSVAVQETCP